MSDLKDIEETVLTRCMRRTSDARIVTRATATSAEGTPIGWFTISAGKNRVTLRRMELPQVAKALLDAANAEVPPIGGTTSQPATPRGARSFPAKYPGTCVACGGRVEVGDPIFLVDRKPQHVGCANAKPSEAQPTSATDAELADEEGLF